MLHYQMGVEDSSSYLYKIFHKDTMIDQNAFDQNIYGKIRQAVNLEDMKYAPLMKSFWLNNTRIDSVKLFTKGVKSFEFNGKFWHLPNEVEVIKMTSTFENFKSDEFQIDKQIVKQISESKNSNKLLTILNQIPKLEIKLSPLQELVVTSNENILCLGRSGTGKTTSSVLRLFSQEIMFTLLKKASKIKGVKNIKISLTSDDFTKPCNMKTVFISASPVLVNEVSRFYQKLKEALFHHLKEKESLSDFQIASQSTQDELVMQKHKEIMELAQIEAELIEEELAANSQLDVPNSFEDLQAKNFPLFVTVKQLLYMYDASLTYSFFSRDKNNNLIGMSSNLTWHNENKGLFMINSEFKYSADFDQLLLKYGEELVQEMDLESEMIQDENEEQKINKSEKNKPYQFRAPSDPKSTSYQKFSDSQLSFEVDYEIFADKFYSRFKQRSFSKAKTLKRLSEATIWTEIFSVIKGGLNSSDFYNGFLRAKDYINKYASAFLSQRERQTVYWIFLEYEVWKKQQNAFDLMDLVQHILTSGKVSSYYGNTMRMDYLMIDEVQDLTPKTLQLLLKLTQQKVYFAGDTAQTIAKGVGARFSDLKTLFANFNTKVLQLTTNYRSHGQILALANSVVSLLETLFPFSIDSLAKEESLTTGLKPLILMPMQAHQLRTFFMGNQGQGQQLTTSHSISKPQFGCNQVVIVREQSQKDRVPDFLKSMLCLTVYESKGLEFDDVILYNFFNSGEIQTGNWKLINEIQITEEDQDDKLKVLVQGLETLLVQEQNLEPTERLGKKQLKRQVLINKNTQERSFVYRKFASLCIELKQLYVAITRPKKRLIIYDDDVQARIPIQRVWEALKVINVVSNTMIEQNQVPEELKDLFSQEGGCLGSRQSNSDEWKLQGIKFYKKKQFDQAIKCFRYAGETELVTKCFAYQKADAGNSMLTEAETICWQIKTLSSQKQNKSEKKILLREQARIRTSARKEFELAAISFNNVGLKQQAASCYYTARKFQQASKLFEELGQFSQAGECLMQSSSVDSIGILRAAEMFERGKLITRAIECYERIEAWERLLVALHSSKHQLKQSERESLANKYIPIALNKLYQMMMGEEKVNESNKGALAELKIKQKYAKDLSEQIQEEEENDYYSESDQDDDNAQDATQQGQDQEPSTVEVQQEYSSVPQTRDDANVSIEIIKSGKSFEIIEGSEEEDYDILEDVFQLKKKRSAILAEEVKQQDQQPKTSEEQVLAEQNASFVIIDEDQDDHQAANLLDNMQKSDFEHLSQYDPDDEFLQSSQSFSLLQSIVSNQVNDQSSEYSIIDDSQSDGVVSLDSSLMSKGSIRFIKSQRKVEDSIVRKIIYYISLFSDEVRDQLSKLGKDATLSNAQSFLREEDIQLESISVEFIEVVLNILEHYELIKLCLILSNKFKLTTKLGRYVVSSCLKYQSIQSVRFTQNIDQFREENQNLKRMRQQSLIAHEALHNVFGLVAPQYLTLKSYNQKLTDQNSLGMDSYRLMFALGYWKKLVYTMNLNSSLDLCYKLADSFNFSVLMDRLSSEESQSELHQTQQALITLKLVNVKLTQEACSLKQLSTVNGIKRLEEMICRVKEYLLMNQIQDNPYVQDLVDLVSFILLPEHQDLKQNEPFKLVNRLLTVENDQKQLKNQKLARQFHDLVLQKGVEVVNRLFKNIAQTKREKIIQSFLAYQFLGHQASRQRLQSATKDPQILKNLTEIYNQAQDFSHKLLFREALFASNNMQALDCNDFLNGNDKNRSDSLYIQYEKTHVLVSVHSQWIEEFAKLQRLTLKTTSEVELIKQGSKICLSEFRGYNKKSKIQELKLRIEKNMHLVDLNSITTSEERQLSAFMIDMDLQFVLVPSEWVKIIIQSSLQIFQERLNTAWINLCLSDLKKQVQEEQTQNLMKFWSKIMMNTIKEYKFKKNTNLEQLLNSSDTQQLQILKNNLSKKVYKLLFGKLRPTNLATVTTKKQKSKITSIYFKLKELCEIFQQYNFEKQLTIGTLVWNSLDSNCDLNDLQAIENTGQAFLFHSLDGRTQKKNESENYLDCSAPIYLANALKLLNKCDKVPQFIEGLSSILKRCKTEERELLISFRWQAYAQICLNHGKILDGIQRLIWSSRSIIAQPTEHKKSELIEKSFYTLLVVMVPTPIIPLHALNYIDSTIDTQAMQLNAQLEDGVDFEAEQQKQEQFEEENVYYDEWDRPEIEEVKNLQLSKRPSQQDVKSHQIISYECKKSIGKVEVVRAQQLLKEVLQNCINYMEDLTDKTELLNMFNIFMSVCINFNTVDPYITQLKKCMKIFDKSYLQDLFYELLFQYTDDPHAIKKMFKDTDDDLKFTFFAQDVYLVEVKLMKIDAQKSLSKNENQWQESQFYRLLAKRCTATLTIKKQICRIVEKSRLNQYILRKYGANIEMFGVDKNIAKIRQNLPNVPTVFKLLSLIGLRLQALQKYYITSQSQVSSFEIQLLLLKQRQFESLAVQLVEDLNCFIRSKWQILSEYVDVGDIDSELMYAVKRVQEAVDQIDGEIVIWSIISQAQYKIREDEFSRTKRMKIKWQQWESLAKRKLRLQDRISRMKKTQ